MYCFLLWVLSPRIKATQINEAWCWSLPFVFSVLPQNSWGFPGSKISVWCWASEWHGAIEAEEKNNDVFNLFFIINYCGLCYMWDPTLKRLQNTSERYCIRALWVKLDSLGLILRVHVSEGNSLLLQVAFDHYVRISMCVYLHVHTYIHN